MAQPSKLLDRTARFVIDRGDHYELTTVGWNGQESKHKIWRLRPDVAYRICADEGSYRRDIEANVRRRTGPGGAGSPQVYGSRISIPDALATETSLRGRR